MGMRWLVGSVVLAAVMVEGCTRESLRVALEAQQRADQVEQAVFDQQHAALTLLLYRDLAQRLMADGVDLTDSRRAMLNAIWNERDMFEFWAIQHERAKALRAAGVDAKLYADQSTIDLLYKSLAAKAGRGKAGLAAAVGARMADETAATSEGGDSSRAE